MNELSETNVARKYGSHFACNFVVQGLTGLARCCSVPKRVSQGYAHVNPSDNRSHRNHNSDLQLLSKSINKLVDYIHEVDYPAGPILLDLFADEL